MSDLGHGPKARRRKRYKAGEVYERGSSYRWRNSRTRAAVEPVTTYYVPPAVLASQQRERARVDGAPGQPGRKRAA